MDRVYLIPGFFGFADLGDFRYFGPVIAELSKHGLTDVHVVPTLPTASLRRRAAALHHCVAATSEPHDRVHLVGHSSGGLDARLWASPGVELDAVRPEDLAGRLRTVVTVSTPHRGTPSADFFATVAGRQLLRVLSLMTMLILRNGGLPLRAVLSVGDLLVGADKVLGAGPDLFDALFDSLLGELSADRREAITSFFSSVEEDQSLLVQLAPAAMDLFDATTVDRPGVHYGSIVSRADPPRVRRALKDLSATAASGYFWYSVCWKLASRMGQAPPLYDDARDVLMARWPTLTREDNDGMVPTLSQPHGEVIRAVAADHLDVLGHFGDPDLVPVSYDWFNTGTGFNRSDFTVLWTDVAHFLLDER